MDAVPLALDGAVELKVHGVQEGVVVGAVEKLPVETEAAEGCSDSPESLT